MEVMSENEIKIGWGIGVHWKFIVSIRTGLGYPSCALVDFVLVLS
jgi:hypothetical protein